MKKRINSIAIVALGGATSLAVDASALIIYAGADWKYFALNPDPWHAETLVDGLFYMTDTVQYHAYRDVGFNPFHAGGVAFFTSGAYGIPSDMVQVTTVYGIDLTPDADLPSLTGFDPLDPELTPLSGETITSRFGTSYSSSFDTQVLLQDLHVLLPGHDMFWFNNGDPTSMLYAFQTYAPFDEFYVPGPTPLALLGIGALSLVRRRP